MYFNLCLELFSWKLNQTCGHNLSRTIRIHSISKFCMTVITIQCSTTKTMVTLSEP